MKKNSLFLLAAIVWFLVTTLLLCLPGNDLPDIGWIEIWHVDKLIHISLFFGLVFFWANSIANEKKRLEWMLWIVLTSVAYGIIMEFVQKYFIPHRSFDIDDMLADAVGSVVAWIWQKKRWYGVI
ncbi:MAG: VanZ family protein [Bacteroidota bacterium]|nr:VanZ family protein [Bacteroidota bacterium]